MILSLYVRPPALCRLLAGLEAGVTLERLLVLRGERGDLADVAAHSAPKHIKRALRWLQPGVLR